MPQGCFDLQQLAVNMLTYLRLREISGLIYRKLQFRRKTCSYVIERTIFFVDKKFFR